MSLTTTANRYARALVDVTIDRDETNEVRKELDQFAALLKDHADLYEAFASPVVAQQRKRNVLQDILAVTLPRVTTANFLKLLLENYRLHNLDAMLAAVGRELDRRAGVVSADVTFARDPDTTSEHRGCDFRKLPAKKFEWVRRSNIIGGVVVRLEVKFMTDQ
jgi:F-type H+-transporting ATPase subunit delta